MTNESMNRPFPIQGEFGKTSEGKRIDISPCTIPWWLAEIAYEYYSAKFGTDQSLERLAERGGFGQKELVSFIRKEFPHE